MLAAAALEAQVPVLADLALEAQLLDLAHLVVEARLPVLVLEAAVPVEQLLSRQSFSAAMARSTP
jgi:hypothetical protein